jgi:hypothetical protein
VGWDGAAPLALRIVKLTELEGALGEGNFKAKRDGSAGKFDCHL